MKAKAIITHPPQTGAPERPRPMRTRTLPFARPDITEAEIAAVNRVMRSGWLTSGPETQKFEEEFAAAVGARHAVAVNSATSALHLGTTEWGLGKGDGVIIPSITFTATAEIVTYSGAVPIIVDVDRSEYMMHPEILERFIERECRFKNKTLIHRKTGAKIRGMIPVHLGGRPAPMKELLAFAKAFGLRTMEDAAHAFPCRYKNQPIGSVSEATAFSFYATKNLTTGEGGMLTTNNAGVARRARMMRLHGIKGQTYGRKRWNYDVVAPGYKYNMTDLAAAMGRVQLSRSDEMLERRGAVAARYREALSDLQGLRIMDPSPHKESHHLFTVEITPTGSMTRNRFVEELYARGIATSLHFIPLYRHSYYRKRYSLSRSEFPNSEEIYARIVSLPLSSSMSPSDAQDVIRAVRETLGAAI